MVSPENKQASNIIRTQVIFRKDMHVSAYMHAIIIDERKAINNLRESKGRYMGELGEKGKGKCN